MSRSGRPPPVGPREWAVVFSASLTLAFTAWGLAGYVDWTLHTMLAGGVLTLFCALIPLPATARLPFCKEAVRLNGDDGEHGNLKNTLRLLASPVFWLGLAFLLYLLIGALNPGHVIASDTRGWWVEAVTPPLGKYWPSSVQTGYSEMNAWRVLVVFTAAFALIWGIWTGVRRRQSALIILWIFVLSGAAMAVVAILQKTSGAQQVLWQVPTSNNNFWGSFFYRNQGAAYLNWVMVGAGLLYFTHAMRARRLGKLEGPHFLCFLLLVATAVSVSMSLSRGGILSGAALVGAFVFLVVCDLAVTSIRTRISIWIPLLAFLVMGGGAFFAYQQLDWSALEKRFADFEETIATADSNDRIQLTRATWDMAEDRLWLGWGAGSFRYIFPMYQMNYPSLINNDYYGPHRPVRAFYRYAHNDIVQFIAEYGLIGVGFLVAAFGSMLASVIRYLPRYPWFVLFLGVGILGACGHAFLDFIFNSPAYWVAFSGVIAVACRLGVLEAQRG